RDVERLQRARRRGLRVAERPRIADRLPGGLPARDRRGEHVVEEQRGLAQRLERGAALRHPRVRPGHQDLLALVARERVEVLPAGSAEQAERGAVPEPEQLRDLLLLGLARAVERAEYPVGDTEVARARDAVGLGAEGVADGLEGLALPR